MTNPKEHTQTITLLNKQFLVKCPPDKEEDLQKAAAFLDGKMHEIQSAGKIFSHEHIAIMAAINLCAELLQLEHQKEGCITSMGSRIRELAQKIEHALA